MRHSPKNPAENPGGGGHAPLDEFEDLPLAEARRLIREMRRNAIELETQNERLRVAQAESIRIETQFNRIRVQETLGLLAGGVANEFNDLLGVILKHTIQGRLQPDSPNFAGSCFEAIEAAALKASDFTRQLMAYSGRMPMVLERADVGEIVVRTAHSVSGALPRNVTLQCDVAEGVPPVRGDALQLCLALANLLTNALEAYGPGMEGVITLRTWVEDLDPKGGEPRAWVLPVAAGRYSVLEVADTGIGMKPEVLERAFDPLFTTKFMGHGLGLPVVAGILKHHKGGLKASSVFGRGSTFRIYLPASSDRALYGSSGFATQASTGV